MHDFLASKQSVAIAQLFPFLEPIMAQEDPGTSIYKPAESFQTKGVETCVCLSVCLYHPSPFFEKKRNFKITWSNPSGT